MVVGAAARTERQDSPQHWFRELMQPPMWRWASPRRRRFRRGLKPRRQKAKAADCSVERAREQEPASLALQEVL